jgi:polyferredoxin
MSTTEEPQKLYAAREPVFPKRVKGTFRNLKWIIMIVTLGIYYVTPWIRFDRGPNLPDQAVLLDLANRRFFFFWIEIWPHEFYFVAGLLIMAGLGLFLFTSALGRVWCGYTCPQTVWTDLFFAVERWIEGDRNARLRLWRAKWDFRKVRLRLTKSRLAPDRGGDRRRLGVLFRRCADAGCATSSRAGALPSPMRPSAS